MVTIIAKSENRAEDSLENRPLQEEKLEDQDEKKPKSVLGTLQYIVKNITVEPAMLLYVVSCMVWILATQNLAIEKACRVNLNFSREICDSLKQQTLGEQNQYERAVQKLVAKHTAARSVIYAVVPSITAIFIGSWTDKTGSRKTFLLVPVIGQIFICLNNTMNTFFFEQLSLEILVYSEVLLEALSGGFCICFLNIYSYISAVTTEKERTFRMGFITFSQSVGTPIGLGISGVLLKRYGYYFCFGLSASLHFINACYIIFWLKNSEKSPEQKKHENKGFRYFINIFFDIAHLKTTIRVVFRKGPNKRRLRMFIIIAIVTVLFGPNFGEISIMYISTRYRFNWDEVKFSIYQTFFFLIHTLGTVFSISVFSNHLQWHDSVLGLISTISKVAASFIYCFATTEYVFYIAPLIEIFNGTSLLAVRSIASKLVSTEDLGKVNSIIGLTENLSPFIYVPLYTTVYTATMEVLPGAVFLLGALLTLPAVAVFIWLYYENRKEQQRKINQAEVEMKFL